VIRTASAKLVAPLRIFSRAAERNSTFLAAISTSHSDPPFKLLTLCLWQALFRIA